MNPVAQLLAWTDDRNAWVPHALEMLTDAAKLARRLEGSVGAWVLASEETPLRGEDTDTLAQHGCHMVHRLVHGRFAQWQSEAIASALAQNTAPGCRLVFLPGTAHGEEVAALLTVRLDALWVPDVIKVAVTRTGTVEITAVESAGRLSRTYRTDSDRPAIVTMRPGVAEASPVDAPDDIRIDNRAVDLSDVAERTLVQQRLPADPKTVDITFAPRIVAGGRGTGGPDGMRRIASLAEALSASVAASRMAVDLGWAPPERQVGQTGKSVCPDLYVACGISGASHHLAGMRDSRHIVAINSDPDAPIHEAAHLSLYGDLHEVVPAIENAMARRNKGAG